MQRKTYKKRLRWKLAVLAGCIMLLIISIIFHQHQQAKRLKEYEKYDAAQALVDDPEEPDEVADSLDAGAEPEPVKEPEQEAVPPEKTEKEGMTIVNLEEYAEPVMGSASTLLEESLFSYVMDEGITASAGTIIHVMVPEHDPSSIIFYILLDDAYETIVMISYHPREKIVTAGSCLYTKEEIISEVWEDNGPEQRGVPESGTDTIPEQEVEDEFIGKNQP